MPLSELLERRSRAVDDFAEAASVGAVWLSLEAVGEAPPKVKAEVKEYVRSGRLDLGGGAPTAANVTMLSAPDLQYTGYFSSSIFRAVPRSGPPKAPAAAQLLATLRPQLEAAGEALRSGRAVVTLVPGDILAVMTSAPPEQPGDASCSGGFDGGGLQRGSQTFDYIDCSNVADYVSLPALLLAAVPLLSPAPHARLRTESMVAWQAARLRNPSLGLGAFVADALAGLPLPLLERLFGLRLAGAAPLPAGRGALRAEWAPAPPSGSGGVTAGGLLLDLLPDFQRLVSKHATALPVTGALDEAAPLALAQLLALAAPRHAPDLLRALIAAAAGGGGVIPARLFEAELLTHVGAQAGNASGPLVRVTYPAKPGTALWQYKPDAPLLLAVSQEPLVAGQPVAFKELQHLVCSFAYDEDAATAHWLTPEAAASGAAGSLHVTLCVLSDVGAAATALVAVGQSAKLCTLRREAVPAASAAWRPLAAPPPALEALDMDLLRELTWRLAAAAPAGERKWRGQACHAAGDAGAAVDVLAPGPLPAASEADITARVEGGALAVTVTPKQGGGGGAGAAVEERFVVALPEGCAGGRVTSVKLSRRLGLLTACVTAEL